ncbi:MAG: hypothetical protein IH987_19090, partial [Planctomycetes bacterium]|nr:hypothetical protein [Planctomycetota bacterium]
MTIRSAVFVFVASARIGPVALGQTIIHVPADAPTIQIAIQRAQPSDTIMVAPGTYFEAIDFLGKAIAVRSSGGRDVTFIDATGLNTSAVTCSSNEGPAPVLSGFTVQGGTGTLVQDDLRGGGMYCRDANPTVTDCTFTGNTAAAGGGMYNDTGSAATVTGCRFYLNTADMDGGGMYNAGSSPSVIDCSFIENHAAEEGGGMRNLDSETIVRGCTFDRNVADARGGAMANLGSNLTISSCALRDNSAGVAGGGMFILDSISTVTDCRFTGNECVDGLSGKGGAVYTSAGTISHFTSCEFSLNAAGVAGGGAYHASGSLLFTKCVFTGNRSVDGGAIYVWFYTYAQLTSCTLNGNVAYGKAPGYIGAAGGAIYQAYGTGLDLVNCTITGNRARLGGGMYNDEGSLRLANSTVVGNVASEVGGGIVITYYGSTIENSIIWGNAASGLGPQIYNEQSRNLEIRYSLIQGSGGSASWDAALAIDGGGNLDADPRLSRVPHDGGDGWSDDLETPDVDEGANDDFGDLRLGLESPAIDTGSVELLPSDYSDLDGDGDQDEPLPLDHDSQLRLVGPLAPHRDPCVDIQVDMGAFEVHNDCNRNGLPDDEEIDDDEDGTPNDCDVCAGMDDFGPDGDNDGIPDPCDKCAGFPDQLDGDEDGIPDSCESPVLYVDAGAIGTRGGESWLNAYTDLQTALAVARNRPYQTTEIWVAAGKYTPDVGPCQEVGSRSSTFRLASNTSIYGGFLGHAHSRGGETDRAQRDPVANPTILSGDILGDDESSFVGYDENSFHVVTAMEVDATTVLDGFEISGGSAIDAADDRGGGILCKSAQPTIRESTIVYNRAGNGGGIGTLRCGAVLENCRIFGNDGAKSGGGVYDVLGTMTFLDCELRANTAFDGGGMYTYISVTTFADTLFIENESVSGAGLYNSGGRSQVTNCRFESNIASWQGGGMHNEDFHTLTISGTAFTNNSGRFGGGLYCDNASVTMNDTSFVGNDAREGGGVYSTDSEIAVTRCAFEANESISSGGGMLSYASSHAISDTVFRGNTAGSSGGGLHSFNASNS